MEEKKLREWFVKNRSPKSVAMDDKRKAKKTFVDPTPEEIALWKNQTNRYDIAGVDAPPVKKKAKTKSGESKRTRSKKADPPKEKYGYSSSWWKSRTVKEKKNDDYDEDDLRSAREMAMALEMEKHGDRFIEEDAYAYLNDDAHDEVSKNSRWKYDPRDLYKEYTDKKRAEAGMYAYRKKSKAKSNSKKKRRK